MPQSTGTVNCGRAANVPVQRLPRWSKDFAVGRADVISCRIGLTLSCEAFALITNRTCLLI